MTIKALIPILLLVSTLASPAVDDGTLYLRTASHLWRIGE